MKRTSVRPLLRMSCLAVVLNVLVLLPAPVLANPLPVDGACCFVYGDCQVIFEYLCQQQGGSYQGDFTTCEPNPCSPGHFACCFPNGNCVVMTSPPLCESQGGTFIPVAECAPSPCPPAGACCHSNGACEILTQAACVELWGGWMGSGETSCVPNPCPACKLPCSSDACCLPDGSCRLTWATTCEAHQGIWKGSGAPCVPDPCATSSAPEPPTTTYETRTWGQIKRSYR
jgi:hypothetical protein